MIWNQCSSICRVMRPHVQNIWEATYNELQMAISPRVTVSHIPVSSRHGGWCDWEMFSWWNNCFYYNTDHTLKSLDWQRQLRQSEEEETCLLESYIEILMSNLTTSALYNILYSYRSFLKYKSLNKTICITY